MATRDTERSKTWIDDMFMSGEEAVKLQAEIERVQGITPEIKRLREIKAGVITASVGIALMLLLFVLMGGIVASGRVSDAAAQILMRLWIVGIIPLMIGAALVFNGMFVSKRTRSTLETGDLEPNTLGHSEPEAFLPPADTNELFPAGFSVTDDTTKHLKEPGRRRN